MRKEAPRKRDNVTIRCATIPLGFGVHQADSEAESLHSETSSFIWVTGRRSCCISKIIYETDNIVTESSASLYTSAESNLGDRVLGDVEKDSFITLPGKGGTQQSPFSKTHEGLCPNPRGFDKEFYNSTFQGWSCWQD